MSFDSGSLDAAIQAIKVGHQDDALSHAKEAVRKAPSSAAPRDLLFQLLCVQGEWDRARTQLDVAAELDPELKMTAMVCRGLIQAETTRAEVFDGRQSPSLVGEPSQWTALLVESLRLRGIGRERECLDLRLRALEDAPALRGTWDNAPFEWIGDVDTRLGPVCEAVLNGAYYWLPLDRLASVRVTPQGALRDSVWAPALFRLTNGGELAGFIPVRYPGTERQADPLLRLARATEWRDVDAGLVEGVGHRHFGTESAERALLSIGEITLDGAADEAVTTHG